VLSLFLVPVIYLLLARPGASKVERNEAEVHGHA
jgi:hypothetical protein